MHTLLHGHGWGALLMIAAIVGWSAVMLLLVYLLTKFWQSPRAYRTPVRGFTGLAERLHSASIPPRQAAARNPNRKRGAR